MRLTNEQLEKIKEEKNINELWSFSRFDKFRTSPYEFFLRYIKHEKPKGEIDSAYAPIGGVIHDILEQLYIGQIQYEDMPEVFEDMWLMNVGILDFKFNKTEKEKNDSIKTKYYQDLKHFVNYHDMIKNKVINEQFILTKVTDDIYFQGYIDAIYKDNDGFYNIIDWKTSTKYSGKAISDHAAQLLIYAAGLHQKGIPFEKIKICWNFLKYVNVEYEQINGKKNIAAIERYQIGEKLQAKAKTWLNKLGYKDSISEYLTKMYEENSIDCLPDNVKEKFKITDCYIFVDNIEQLYNELKKEIEDVIIDINNRKELYDAMKVKDDHIWYDDEESLSKQSYYFWNLCEYSIDQLKPFKEYVEKLEKEKEDPLGMSQKKQEDKDDDMSWLKDIV